MNRPFLASALIASALIAMSCGAAVAQQSGQQNPYQGQSNPPADDNITTDTTPAPKPPAGHRMAQPQAAPVAPAQDQDQPQNDPAEVQTAPQPAPAAPISDDPAARNNADAVALPPPAYAPPLAQPALSADPDGDIVHPRPLAPGEIGEGTTIRVRLLDRLSTALTEKGEPFHSQVAVDVMQGGQVLIPAGTEIDGTVVEVSSGHAGGSGSMRLRPDMVILADGTRYRLFAEITGTPGSSTHVVGEGTIKPDSRWKRDSIEYGGAVGAGAITGAIVAGPVGALTGSLIGAGAVTTHLLVSHPQATLDPGTTLFLTLTEPMSMTAPVPSGN